MKTFVIWNPAAGRGRAIDWGRLRILLNEPFELARTTGPYHATELAQQVVEGGFERLWVAGGDGTLNEVLNGVMDSPLVLGVIPLGTANEWARELGLPPKRWEVAVRKQLESRPTPFDVGLVECPDAGIHRYFLLMAGAGFDGHVISHVVYPIKRRVGVPYYGMLAFWLMIAYRPFRLVLDRQSFPNPVYVAIACNAAHYAFDLRVCPDAQPTDGVLALAVCSRRSAWQLKLLLPALHLLMGRLPRFPGMEYRRFEQVQLTFDPPVPLQVDGDYAGKVREMSIRVLPAAVRFLAG